MLIKNVSLSNFRNYQDAHIELSSCKSILIGENAQGKTNFIEAIEFAAHGKTTRAAKDIELVHSGQQFLNVEIYIQRDNFEHTISISLKPSAIPSRGLEKQIKINGVSKLSARDLAKALVTVSFKSQDLNLLRGGGPKFRRNWIDSIAFAIQPMYHDVLSSYNKVLAQRNRYLKDLGEKGKITVTDQDQLIAWDKQLAKFGTRIIKQRTKLLHELLPKASKHHSNISGNREILSSKYFFRAADQDANESDEFTETSPSSLATLTNIHEIEEIEINAHLLRLLKENRSEEIWRRQTLVGPHRDDITFELNNANAISFASQGQQRSLVLALKLAELERVAEQLDDYPVLLLDDVLAELDIIRQGFLMSAIPQEMQTIITTTHISAFEPHWLDKAQILSVTAGKILPTENKPLLTGALPIIPKHLMTFT